MTEDTIDPIIGLKNPTTKTDTMDKVEEAYRQLRSSANDDSPEFGDFGWTTDDFSLF